MTLYVSEQTVIKQTGWTFVYVSKWTWIKPLLRIWESLVILLLLLLFGLLCISLLSLLPRVAMLGSCEWQCWKADMLMFLARSEGEWLEKPCVLSCLVDFQFRFSYLKGWNKIETKNKTSGWLCRQNFTSRTEMAELKPKYSTSARLLFLLWMEFQCFSTGSCFHGHHFGGTMQGLNRCPRVRSAFHLPWPAFPSLGWTACNLRLALAKA